MFKNSKQFLSFEFWSFVLVSDFDIRISNFSILNALHHTHHLHQSLCFVKADFFCGFKDNTPLLEGVESIIFAATHVRARNITGSALAQNNTSRLHSLSLGTLDAKIFWLGISPQTCRCFSSTMCHVLS